MSGRGSGVEVLVAEQRFAVLGSGRARASVVLLATSCDDAHRVLDAEARGRSAHPTGETEVRRGSDSPVSQA
jgi:hypothetical protein